MAGPTKDDIEVTFIAGAACLLGTALIFAHAILGALPGWLGL